MLWLCVIVICYLFCFVMRDKYEDIMGFESFWKGVFNIDYYFIFLVMK